MKRIIRCVCLEWSHALTALQAFFGYETKKVPYDSVYDESGSVPKVHRPQAPIVSNIADPKAYSEALEIAVELARRSLEEVKALTEYQDSKAGRLLTVVAFLAALSGALYSGFAENFPLRDYAVGSEPNWKAALVVASHVAFYLFILFAAIGAMTVFFAIRTQFNTGGKRGSFESRLFFLGIAGTSSRDWADMYFRERGAERFVADANDLRFVYLKNYVAEAHLVAGKIQKKLHYLQPAQMTLKRSINMLIIWILLYANVALLLER